MDRCLAQNSWQSLRESFRQLRAAGELFEAFTQGRLDDLSRLALKLSEERLKIQRQRQELSERRRELESLEARDHSLIEQSTAEAARLNELLSGERAQLDALRQELSVANQSLLESQDEMNILRIDATKQQDQAIADQLALEEKLAEVSGERERLQNELALAELHAAEVAETMARERQLVAAERAKESAELQLLEEALELHAQAAAGMKSSDTSDSAANHKIPRSIGRKSPKATTRPDPVLNGLIAQMKQLTDSKTQD